MASEPIRWLHLSDFHMGKKDSNYAQPLMLDYILQEVERRVKNGHHLDLIFITGDLADNGHKEQYEDFYGKFYFPLLERLGKDWLGKIFMIPGNHDVNWDEAKAVKKHGVMNQLPNFLNPDSDGLKLRQPLFPRFLAYTDHDYESPQDRWIESEAGTYSEVLNIRGISIEIIGLNTAWLSENNEDNEPNKDRWELTPGCNLLREALKKEKHKKAQLRIVLGHHPLNWFREEDERAVKRLLADNKALYLHGHLHQAGELYEYGAGKHFLALCTGAAFKTRPEDQIKKNGILFCDYIPEEHCLRAEPRQWHDDQWRIDGTAFPDEFRMKNEWKWELSLPKEGLFPTLLPVSVNTEGTAIPEATKLPLGWKIIDGAFLAEERAHPLTIDAILRYFDGRLPLWSHALCPLIPKRAIVHKLKDIFQDLHDKKEPQGILLVGPGGEGKSTVLMQTVCELVDSGQWQVLWHEDPESPLPADFYTSLEAGEISWLIASDDADLIAQALLPAIKSLREAGRARIHFLLCARKTDWLGAEGHKLAMEMHGALREISLRGITLEDAGAIVKAWSECGEGGLGKLAGLPTDEAAKNLVQAATSDTYAQDGAFLGAMLQTRYGEMLKDHIKDLLGRLQKRKAPGGTLMRAFAYIVALHAENKHLLTKPVLAQALKCEPRDILPRVIGPLGDEAAFAPTGRYILTRHRVIAEVARDILTDIFYLDFDEIYIDLARSAQELRRDGGYVYSYADYSDLSSYFFDKGNPELGIRLARSQLEANPKHPYLYVRLSRLYRAADQSDMSVEIFRTAPQEMQRHRAFYTEWGTAEGNLGNQETAAWLAGMSLADGTEIASPDNDDAKQSLAGLGVGLGELYNKYRERIFIEAQGAVAQLGFKLILDDTAKKYFLKYQANSHQGGVTEVEDALALERVIRGIVLAGEKSGATLPDYIPRPETLTFEGLKSLLKLRPGFSKAKLISLPKDQ